MKGVAYSFPCLAYLYLYLSLYTLVLFQVTKGQPKFHVLLLCHSALGLAWVLLIFHSAPEYVPVLIGGPCFIDLYRTGHLHNNSV